MCWMLFSAGSYHHDVELVLKASTRRSTACKARVAERTELYISPNLNIAGPLVPWKWA